MRLSFVLPLAFLALAACHPQGDGNPAVDDVRVRLPAVEGRPGAGYFTIRGGSKDDRLTRIDSAVVEKIELHEMAMDGGVIRMRELTDVPVPAGTTVSFAQGGNHAMLFGIDPRIVPGTGIPMLLTFASGARIEVEAKTVAAGDDIGGGQSEDAHH